MGRRTPLILLGICAAAAVVWAVRPSVSPLAPAVVAADENPPASPKAELKTDRQKGSYALGHKIAANIHRNLGDTTLDLDAFLLGMREAFSGKGASMNEADREKAFNAFQSELSVPRSLPPTLHRTSTASGHHIANVRVAGWSSVAALGR